MTKRTKKYPPTLILFFFLFFLSAQSLAQSTTVAGYDLQFHKPQTDPFSIWSTQTTEMLQPGQSYINLENNVSGGQLSVAFNNTPHKILDKILTSNLVYNIGIAPFVSTGVDVAFHSWIKGSEIVAQDPDLFDDEFVFNPFQTWAMGDIRLFTKWKIYRPEKNSWVPGIGLFLYSTLPSGEENKFVGMQTSTLGGSLIIDKETKYFTIATNVGYQSIPEKVVFGMNIDDRLTYSAGVSVPTRFANKVQIELIAEVMGHMQFQNKSVLTSPMEYHTGIKTTFPNGLGFTIGGGNGINNAVGNADYRAVASIFWTQPKEKTPTVLAQGQDTEANLTPLSPPFESTPNPQTSPSVQVPQIQNDPIQETSILADKINEQPTQLSLSTNEENHQNTITQPNMYKDTYIFITSVFFDSRSTKVPLNQIQNVRDATNFILKRPEIQSVILEAPQKITDDKTLKEKTKLAYERASQIKETLEKNGFDKNKILIRTVHEHPQEYSVITSSIRIIGVLESKQEPQLSLLTSSPSQ